MAYRILNVL